MEWNTFKNFCEKHELSPRDILEMIYAYLLENGEEPELFTEIDNFFSNGVELKPFQDFENKEGARWFRKWIWDYISYQYKTKGVIPTIEKMHKVFRSELKNGEDPALIEEGLRDFRYLVEG